MLLFRLFHVQRVTEEPNDNLIFNLTNLNFTWLSLGLSTGRSKPLPDNREAGCLSIPSGLLSSQESCAPTRQWLLCVLGSTFFFFLSSCPSSKKASMDDVCSEHCTDLEPLCLFFISQDENVSFSNQGTLKNGSGRCSPLWSASYIPSRAHSLLSMCLYPSALFVRLFILFSETGFLCVTGCSGTQSVDRWPPECWD